jgi:hypothetical protein
LSMGRSAVVFAERASKTVGKQHSARNTEEAATKSAGADTV